MSSTKAQLRVFRVAIGSFSPRVTTSTTASISNSIRQILTSAGPAGKPNSHNKNGPHEEKPRREGWYTRGIYAFVIGVPLGWVVHTVNEKSNGAIARCRGDFVRYNLVHKEHISPTSSVFTLKPTTNAAIEPHDQEWDRSIVSVQFKQPQLQIARWYTLLPPIDGQEADELRFLIRKEQNGEVSGYLHRLPVGSEVEVRGPSAEFVLPERVRTVIFLAGGTGIAPAMQVADILAQEANVHLLWANRRREDCVGGENDTTQNSASGWSFANPWTGWFRTSAPKQPRATNSLEAVMNGATVAQLEQLKEQASSIPASKGTLSVDYYVDEEGTFIRPNDVSKLVQALSHSVDHSDGDRLFLVSGPEGFVNYWAGPRKWPNSNEVQSPPTGVLSTINLADWTVVRL